MKYAKDIKLFDTVCIKDVLDCYVNIEDMENQIEEIKDSSRMKEKIEEKKNEVESMRNRIENFLKQNKNFSEQTSVATSVKNVSETPTYRRSRVFRIKLIKKIDDFFKQIFFNKYFKNLHLNIFF